MSTENYSPDNKDLAILRLLQKDAKLSVRDIAARINLSATPTHERIKRLERLGIIKEYTTVVDRKKVGKGMMVICMIALNAHNKKTATRFIEEVSHFREVVEFYNISGDFDFMLKILAPNMDEFHEFFVNKLSEIEGIGQTKSIFVMNSIKESGRIL
ncbi:MULTISPECIES: Lrp/AsnC family transcriptional regulator [Chryseobacterium]|uniref:Lrp/AsnC family leucine-responsive transcriptional regulator n=1 Tax=Chryseobacterium camelliae TaxID=1265445 RepID=A0ABU0TID5_9FLAO|nr:MULTISPECIES: Lrp/AsnC family transcriptional regulator [Chryseobacterium]MDT3409316.1 Lrp/AsnC family leucine-responsive transcriptional regulator [Pseudacidovorax intermedius]MDQ1096821.1 Lrp/AsnC family leucine-responsive transcriptional regulator [Chryseobacterium camelliae]MDQ1100762.1 Lrp/AsnC family leucine-responsive transcriptional regulator [Chryseobacterium sp. SORGH_AS_1048]MDR6088101.1 Lrp/AsnC family leucine-responsive transcriptional regulator [Chryseobacterium sp. SORGH_AS_09